MNVLVILIHVVPILVVSILLAILAVHVEDGIMAMEKVVVQGPTLLSKLS